MGSSPVWGVEGCRRMNRNAVLLVAGLGLAFVMLYVMMVDRVYAHCLTENKNPSLCWVVRPPWR